MNKKGFSLMEMLTVVIIVGLLASVALPQYRKIVEKGRFSKAQAMAKNLHDSCERLVAEFGVEEWADLRENRKKMTALDIVGSDTMPAGFVVADDKVQGRGFSYSLTGNCGISIKKYEGNYKAEFVFSGTEFTCTEIDEESCNVYGLD